jgi:hypothetical protein
MADDLCLGKLPARPNAVLLKFATYADFSALPPVPADFGHEEYVPSIPWGMNGNDVAGVCVVAGGAHETILFNRMAGKTITITTQDTFADFQSITGLPPSPLVGADMQKAAAFRQKYGLRDSTGQRHKIAAYVALRPGDLRELYAAMYLFGAVGVSIHFPTSGFDQFRRHQAWAVVSGMHIEADHYIPCMALRSNIVCVTWGRFQAIRPSFYAAMSDEALAYISQEALIAGKSPEGFDYAALATDLNLLNG